MASHQVLIIGCGIAGPVLALLLKGKGYNPVVFEKVNKLGDAGASLAINPNGNKVLDLVGIYKQIREQSTPLQAFEDSTAEGETLGISRIPTEFSDRYGFDAFGVKRTDLNLLLRETLLRSGIEVREGWSLERLEEDDESITAHFNGGRSASGIMLCGCDGIKAASRSLILEAKGVKEPAPTYTGLSQTAGISPTPAGLQHESSLRNWYGDGAHVIAYPVNSTLTSWAITRGEKEQTKETWRLYDSTEMIQVKQGLEELLLGFTPNVLDLIQGAERITKFGLFDRMELPAEQWFSKRCVLLGDAAHPTSPHLGQGANQALEDCFYLAEMLPKIETNEKPLTNDIGSIFQKWAQKRQPRTSVLVKGAREKGEQRVSGGSKEVLMMRNEALKASWSDAEAVTSRYDSLFKGHPYTTEAENRLG